MCKVRIGAVVPVYNHPRHLLRLVHHLREQDLPVILIDDGSSDECPALMAQLQHIHANHVHVLRHPRNRGKGAAVRSGLLQAESLGWSHVLQVDVDGQHHWPDVSRFMAQAQQHPQHMVIGKPVFDASVSKTRFYGRYATHIWVWINTLSTDIQDSMCGFRVYPVAPACAQIRRHNMDERMGFDSEILVYLHWYGVKFINLPTPVTYPSGGVSHFLPWRDNLNLSRTHAKLFFGMLWRLPMLLSRRLGR